MRRFAAAYLLFFCSAASAAEHGKVVWYDSSCDYFIVESSEPTHFGLHRRMGGEPIRAGDVVEGELRKLGPMSIRKNTSPIETKTYLVSYSEELAILRRFAPFECMDKWTARPR
jgi:hypothetical protein